MVDRPAAAGSALSGDGGGTDDGGGILLRVFVHPACTKCTDALAEARRVAGERPERTLRRIDLADRAGLKEALREHVRILPTVIVSRQAGELRRFEGTPAPGALRASLERLEG